MSYSKVIVSGDVMEIYEYEKEPSIAGCKHKVRKNADGSGLPRTRDRRPDNLRRLRKGFIRLVRTNVYRNGAPAFLTLTCHANLALSAAQPFLARFFKTLQFDLKKRIRYIAVPEFQKRGAVHFHCLVWDLPDEVIFHESSYAAWSKKTYRQHTLVRRYVDWSFERAFDVRDARGSRYLQACWGLGFVDCVPTDGSTKLAGYLAKYMQKAMQDDRLGNRRAYYTGLGMHRPMLAKTTIPHTFAEIVYPGDKVLRVEKSFDTLWLGRCNYKMFKLTG